MVKKRPCVRDRVSETTNKESCACVLQRSGGQPPSRCSSQEGYTLRFLGCESEAACPREQSYLQQTKNHVLGSYNGPGGSPRPVAMVPTSHTKILWLMWGGAWLRHHGGGATEDHGSETESPRPWVLSHRFETEGPTVSLKAKKHTYVLHHGTK